MRSKRITSQLQGEEEQIAASRIFVTSENFKLILTENWRRPSGINYLLYVVLLYSALRFQNLSAVVVAYLIGSIHHAIKHINSQLQARPAFHRPGRPPVCALLFKQNGSPIPISQEPQLPPRNPHRHYPLVADAINKVTCSRGFNFLGIQTASKLLPPHGVRLFAVRRLRNVNIAEESEEGMQNIELEK
ncbi:hypothetical protein CEXT_545391 [Caerostris extrusa]|uniref:Uncharacterized protein n=1 Tax=Caerostris extrusa TaxID=172846 RepID=A0AAV4S8W1_CAEEX|nr:hypothetical protein CEXT_545391 [Caerostris extrusa]